jgi:hypothetical protein
MVIPWLPAGGTVAAMVKPGGAFSINGLPPGHYLLRAQTNSIDSQEIGTAEVDVQSTDVDAVRIQTPPPSTNSLRVVLDDGATQVVRSGTVRYWPR